MEDSDAHAGAAEGEGAGGGSGEQGMDAGGGEAQPKEEAAEEPEEAIPGVTIPVARVKRMMRNNPDKKKNFSKEAVQCVAAGMELFLADFAKNVYQFTVDKKRKTLSIADVAECIRLVPRFEFLDGPGIIPDVSERQKKPRVQAAPAPTVAHTNAIQASLAAAQAQAAADAAAAAAVAAAQAAAAQDAGAAGGAAPQGSADGTTAGAEVQEGAPDASGAAAAAAGGDDESSQSAPPATAPPATAPVAVQ